MSNFIIDDEDKMKAKMDLVSSLVDINAAIELANKSKKKGKESKISIEENPMDVDF